MENNSIIPKEIFQPLADVANNLIDKLSSAAGYIVVPKGKKKDKEEAVEFFIEEIKNNTQMPALAKAAAISNARKMIKEFSNQNDIVNMAIEQLSENSNPDNIEEGWLEDFLDKAKNVPNEELKVIYAKILAEECNRKGSTSKQLLNILSIIDSNTADAFRRVCSYLVKEKTRDGKKYWRLFITEVNETEEHNINVTFDEFQELNNIGLINCDTIAEYISTRDSVELEYGKSIYKINKCPEEGCTVGYVNFTNAGTELASIFPREFLDEYEDEIEEYLKSREFEIERIIKA